ncbi:hypothetical protein GCM10027447_12270 [Glycomyces halotolerans]
MSSTQSLRIQLIPTQAILHTAERLRAENGGHEYVGLARLRRALPDYTRTEIDQALTDLAGTHTVRLLPESNQKTLTREDREAALWLGGEYQHLIAPY